MYHTVTCISFEGQSNTTKRHLQGHQCHDPGTKQCDYKCSNLQIGKPWYHRAMHLHSKNCMGFYRLFCNYAKAFPESCVTATVSLVWGGFHEDSPNLGLVLSNAKR